MFSDDLVYIFIKSHLHIQRSRTIIFWGLYTRHPKVDAKKHHEHSDVDKYKQRSGSLELPTSIPKSMHAKTSSS